MARLIEFDRSNHRQVLLANDEVETHTVDSVLPRLEVVPLVHPEYTRQPDLGQHNVLGQRLTQMEVEDLFWHRERLRELEWPNVFTLLPQQIARLFARALDADVVPPWVRNASCCAACRHRCWPGLRGRG